ncbi:MAG TPA: aminotransferase class IV [Bacteroidia bacterium]|nr:aminotransferase class IV [Bacteroidia bacterium]
MMYYNDDTTVFINGAFLKAKDAACSMYAQTMHYGYATFEGIRAYLTPEGTRMFKGKEHYERLKRSCELVNLPLAYSVDELVAATYELLKKNNLKEAYDYFLAGRNAGFVAIGASIFTSNIGSEHIVGLAGQGAATGMAMAHWELHAWILILLSGLFVPFYYKAGVQTIPLLRSTRLSNA